EEIKNGYAIALPKRHQIGNDAGVQLGVVFLAAILNRVARLVANDRRVFFADAIIVFQLHLTLMPATDESLGAPKLNDPIVFSSLSDGNVRHVRAQSLGGERRPHSVQWQGSL